MLTDEWSMSPVGKPTAYGDGLMVKFKRAELITNLEAIGVEDGDTVVITVIGDLLDSNISFEGFDTIIVNTK
jgi:hypothetical protein